MKSGHQVGYLKALLQEQDNLPAALITLRLDGKVMIDPLSLCDYAALTTGQETTIEVQACILKIKMMQLNSVIFFLN